MGRLVEFPAADGATVLVEVGDVPGGPVTRGLRDGVRGDPARADRSIEDAVARVTPAADAVLGAVTSLQHRPDEVSVEFGIELTAEAGAFIATVGTTANFTVTVTWKNPGGTS